MALRRLTGSHKNCYAFLWEPDVLPVLSAATRLVTLFYLFNYSSVHFQARENFVVVISNRIDTVLTRPAVLTVSGSPPCLNPV